MALRLLVPSKFTRVWVSVLECIFAQAHFVFAITCGYGAAVNISLNPIQVRSRPSLHLHDWPFLIPSAYLQRRGFSPSSWTITDVEIRLG